MNARWHKRDVCWSFTCQSCLLLHTSQQMHSDVSHIPHIFCIPCLISYSVPLNLLLARFCFIHLDAFRLSFLSLVPGSFQNIQSSPLLTVTWNEFVVSDPHRLAILVKGYRVSSITLKVHCVRLFLQWRHHAASWRNNTCCDWVVHGNGGRSASYSPILENCKDAVVKQTQCIRVHNIVCIILVRCSARAVHCSPSKTPRRSY